MTANRNQLWTEEQQAKLRELAEAGISASRAAAKFKRSRSAVISQAQRLGIRFKRPLRTVDLPDRDRKPQVKDGALSL